MFWKISMFLLVSVLMLNVLIGQNVVDNKEIRLITLNPGHFHAALIQKSMYPQLFMHQQAPMSICISPELMPITKEPINLLSGMKRFISERIIWPE